METITFTQISQKELKQIIESSITSVLERVGKSNSVVEKDKILNLDEASEFLSLSRHTIYGLVAKSAIPVLKKRRKLYFSQDDLIAWLKDSRRGTKSEANHEADQYLSKINKGGKS